jgi:nicotinamidase/pyrazinamidase
MYFMIEHLNAKNDDLFDVTYCQTLEELNEEYSRGPKFGGCRYKAKEIDGGKKMKRIFWNVDTQYDFMRADGKLYVQGAETIEDNLQRLTLYAELAGEQRINTADKHKPDSEELSAEPDLVNTFPEHCMEGTRGLDYIDATVPLDAYVIDWTDTGFDREAVKEAKDIILYKDAFDIFAGNPHAEEVVKTLSPDEVIVYGVATNVCVDQAVMGLRERGIEVYVPTDAIKELPHLPLEETLDKWKVSGVNLTTVDDIIRGDYRR